MVPVEDEREPHDPIAEAWADGYAKGLGEAQEAAAQLIAEQEAARQKIEFALGKLDVAMQTELQDRLRETVIALAAATMLARAEDQRVIRLPPEDLALIAARLPEDWHFEPDASLERGALRVEGATGGVEDGPEQWRRAIHEALRQC